MNRLAIQTILSALIGTSVASSAIALPASARPSLSERSAKN